MRETRLYGSEGGGTEINRSFLPLYDLQPSGIKTLPESGQVISCQKTPSVGGKVPEASRNHER
jgi:hypothetical protein